MMIEYREPYSEVIQKVSYYSSCKTSICVPIGWLAALFVWEGKQKCVNSLAFTFCDSLHKIVRVHIGIFFMKVYNIFFVL